MTQSYSNQTNIDKNLSGKNLRGRNFEKQNLAGFNFDGCSLQGANFTKANLEGASFKNAKAGLEKRTKFRLITSALIFTIIAVIVLEFLAQRAADRIVYLYIHNPGIYPDEIGNNIWVAIIIALLLIVFVCNIYKGLEKALTITFGTGVVVVILSVVYAITQAFVQVARGDVIEYITRDVIGILAGTATGTTTGIAIGCAGTVFALPISAAYMVDRKRAKIVILSSLFVVIPIALAMKTAGTANNIISTFIIVFIAYCGLISGLYIANRVLKEDIKYAIIRNIAVALAARAGTNFHGAILVDADFSGATLKNTNFREATITGTCFFNAKQLELARPGTTYLSNIKIRELVVTGDGRKGEFESYDLRGTNLCGANLEGANLTGVDLYQANLQGANLAKTKLMRAQLERADLTGACLTGSCIQDWSISKTTKLEGIVCDYIFLKWVNEQMLELMPHRGNFKPNGFVLFVTHILDTVEIYHQRDINARLALTVLKKMSKDYDEPLDIMAVGKRGDNVFIKVKLSEHVEPEEFKKDYFSRYDEGIMLLSSNSKQLPLVDELIETKIAEIASEKSQEVSSINVTHIEYINAKEDVIIKGEVIVENIKSNGDSMIFNAPVGIGKAENSTFNSSNIAGVIQNENSKTLAETAAEIQDLLKQLEKSNPSTTMTEKMAVATKAVDEVEKNPALKARVIGALKAGSIETFKEAINHPLVNIFLAGVEGWKEGK